MIKEFIPYQQALALKELGFDEPCFMTYLNGKLDKELFLFNHSIRSHSTQEFTSAPTFSQAFRWFREKYAIYTNINYDWNDEVFRVTIMKQNEDKSCNIIFLKEGEYIKEYNSYEEAELDCLIKLIEIVKTK